MSSSAQAKKEAEKFFEAKTAKEHSGARLDQFLATQIPDLSRSRLKLLLLGGQVRVNGRNVGDPAYRVKPGETVMVRVPAPEPAKPKAQKMPLDVVFEDGDLIVINKPAGLVVHPGAGNKSGTLVNALIAHCGDSLSGIGGEIRPGIVHRLDKDTSGLLVIAKNDKTHNALSKQFADHGKDGSLTRAYMALVWGVPDPRRGSVNAPIARDPKSREKMAVLPGGKHAVTHYEILERYAGRDGLPIVSLVECRLETGRTHQIRVHMTRLGYPLLGDEVYGAGFRTKSSQLTQKAQKAFAALNRQALHAWHIGFVHPGTGKKVKFERRFPPDLQKLVDSLKSS